MGCTSSNKAFIFAATGIFSACSRAKPSKIGTFLSRAAPFVVHLSVDTSARFSYRLFRCENLWGGAFDSIDVQEVDEGGTAKRLRSE